MTLHPLGRVKQHDERSRRFAFPASYISTLKSVQWPRHAPVFDQGNLGSCTGNACLGALGTSPLYDALSVKPPYTEDEAVAIYSAATHISSPSDPYPPDDVGSSGLAVAQVAKADGWLSGYQHALSFEAALSALAVGPVIVGVDWHDGFDTPTAAGECVLSGSVRGGHELCVDTLDMGHRLVWFTNSWGSSWGINGRAWWSFDTFEKLLAADGDCTILVPDTAPAPVPTPAPTPTPAPDADGCLLAVLRPFASGQRTYVRKADRTAFSEWMTAKGYTTTEVTMDWNKLAYVGRDFVAAFLAAALGIVLTVGGNPLDMTPKTLHEAVGAGIAAVVLIVYNWANTCNKAYGRGAL